MGEAMRSECGENCGGTAMIIYTGNVIHTGPRIFLVASSQTRPPALNGRPSGQRGGEALAVGL